MSLTAIETDRLHIRAFRPDDWPAVYSYASDVVLMHYMEQGPLAEAEVRAYVEQNAGPDPRSFAITLHHGDTVIGHMPFHAWFAPRTYEIGWVLSPAYHRRGYASEAASALLKYGFEELHLHRIIATSQPENIASAGVMEKIGMRREGLFRKCLYRADTTWWDEAFYALLEEEWFTAHPSSPAEE